MTALRRRPAAPIIFIAFTLALSGCVPSSGGPATAGPATSVGPPATPTTPDPTAPTPAPSFVRPTPTPLPTFLSYVVKPGDTLQGIARTHRTTVASLAFWNRTRYPSLDPDAPEYDPDRIEIGWGLLLVPDAEIDEDDTFPDPSG